MTGKICTSTTPYYDSKDKKNKFKKRPVLVLGQADCGDYVVLPVSTITHRENVDAVYDVYVDVSEYPNTGLARNSFIRTHKQTIVSYASLTVISDLKICYPDLYNDVIDLVEKFQAELLSKAR